MPYPKPTELLERARRGDPTAAAALWRAIDAGGVPEQVALAWLRDVAGQVVAKVLNPDTPANRAREKARAALGLEGRVDQNDELRRFVEAAGGYSSDELADAADLVVDVGRADRAQIKRKIEYIRSKEK